ncbi:MAG: glycosyltransferase family 9 protein [Verrucomicrobia bacterium]|nr:glycosyltransferase family 9 protein [Verrucomicrobiota bacterium]
MNLVIFKFVNLGDNVVFLPVVQTLRARFPDWRITLLTTPREAPLYAVALPAADVLTAPQARFNSAWRRPWELVRWWRWLRASRPDACLISFDQGNVAHLLARHSGARVRVGATLPHVRVAGSITHDISLPDDRRVASWHWAMARALVPAGSAGGWPEAPPAPDLSHLAGPAEKSPRRRVVIHAGSNQALTRWPLEHFATVAARLAFDCDVTWIDRPETSAAMLPAAVRRVSPADLRGLVTLLAGAELFLGNNSGPMHVANALGCRGVVVSGPTAHGWDPFWFRERWQVLRHPALPCVPCEWRTDFRPVRDCHLAHDRLACLRHWTADAVETACREQLTRAPA